MMKMKNKNEGSALIYTLIVMVIALSIVSSTMMTTIFKSKSTNRARASIEAIQAADSGIEYALGVVNNREDSEVKVEDVFNLNSLDDSIECPTSGLPYSTIFDGIDCKFFLFSYDTDTSQYELIEDGDADVRVDEIVRIRSLGSGFGSTGFKTTRALQVDIADVSPTTP